MRTDELAATVCPTCHRDLASWEADRPVVP